MQLISHPFRLESGSIATVEQGTDAAHGEQLAVLLLTRRGERVLVPMFGVNDPAFHRYDQADIELGLELFGPDITLADVETTITDTSTQEVLVRYE